jgi:phenylalanyl-tRNA synthetase beta chain
LDLESALSNASSKKSFSQLPKFPSMTRDLALVIDRDIPIATVDACIVKFGGQYLESVRLFDIYTGKQIDESKKSVAYKLVFRSKEGTLTDEIVNKAQTRLLNKLSTELNAILR